MAQFRYYVSQSPGTPSPPTGNLLSMEADLRADALTRIRDSDGAPSEWPAVWAHVLVWMSSNGEQRGFESVRLR